MSEPSTSDRGDDAFGGRPEVSRLVSFWAAFALTLRQVTAGIRKVLLLLAIAFFPAGIVGLVVAIGGSEDMKVNLPKDFIEIAIVLGFHIQVLLLAYMVTASLFTQEVSDQTISYLLLKPLPKWMLAIARTAAGGVSTALLSGAGIAVCYPILLIRADPAPETGAVWAVVAIVGGLALTAFVASSIFALFGLLVPHPVLAMVLAGMFVIFDFFTGLFDSFFAHASLLANVKTVMTGWLSGEELVELVKPDRDIQTRWAFATLAGMLLGSLLLSCLLVQFRSFDGKKPVHE